MQRLPQLANLALYFDAEELANGAVPLLRVRLDLEQYQLGIGAPEGCTCGSIYALRTV